MEFFTTLILATGLAMDAFAVSVSRGTVLKSRFVREGLILALVFGGFQAVMPLIGWAAGGYAAGFVEGYGAVIAALILFMIGGKMLYDGLHPESESTGAMSRLSFISLLLLGVATSIDALAVGVSFALLGTSPLMPAIIIGFVTAVFSFAGVFAGQKAGDLLEERAVFIGGLVLVAIGVKVITEVFF